jgi:glutamate---cysteine ligase / carboxylate-amine ligase
LEEARGVTARADGYTLGVEEEYQIVDVESRGMSPRGKDVLRRAREVLGGGVAPKMLVSQIEVMTPVCRTLAEVRSELLRLRRGVIEASAAEGSTIVAASTHPFARWGEQEVTPKERYEGIVDRFRRLAEQQLSFGFHVHVGLKEREAAVEVLNRLRPWLAPLLALSANSPFWLGEDSGYASYRTQVWGRFPTAGPPAPFASLAEHDALVEALVESGSVPDAAGIYWDARLPQELETVEIRVADVCTKVDEAVMLTGLCRALARTCRERAEREEPYPNARPELVRAAHFVASRDGLDADLVDVEARRAVPAREMIGKLLAFARPALEEFDDWEEVSSLVGEALGGGNGASRQRRAYGRAGRLDDVVEMLIEETAQGTNPV